MPHTDVRTVRIEKLLASGLGAIRAAVSESESLSDQTLAEDLHQVVSKLSEIQVLVCRHGRDYARHSATVRN